MSWPVRSQGYAYQVCLGCGAKRLFDEERFRAYGPWGYDLNKMIAWSKAARRKSPLYHGRSGRRRKPGVASTNPEIFESGP